MNLMYTWLVEEKSTRGLEEVTTGVEQELRKRGELLLEGPSKILKKSLEQSGPIYSPWIDTMLPQTS